MLKTGKLFLWLLVMILFGAQAFTACGKPSNSNDTPIDKEHLTIPGSQPNPGTNPPPAKDECARIAYTTHTIIIRYGITTNPELRAKAYDPSELTIKSCDKVVWRNEDKRSLNTMYHTATADNLKFSTEAILFGKESRPIQIIDPGEYPYHCQPHSWMKGKIIVTP